MLEFWERTFGRLKDWQANLKYDKADEARSLRSK